MAITELVRLGLEIAAVLAAGQGGELAAEGQHVLAPDGSYRNLAEARQQVSVHRRAQGTQV